MITTRLSQTPPPTDFLVFFDEVNARTDGRGADVAVDLVGGDQTEVIWTCMAREGRYLPVGFNDDPQSGVTGRPLRKAASATANSSG